MQQVPAYHLWSTVCSLEIATRKSILIGLKWLSIKRNNFYIPIISEDTLLKCIWHVARWKFGQIWIISLPWPTRWNLWLSSIETKFPWPGITAQPNNHHVPVKAVYHAYPLGSFPWHIRKSIIHRNRSYGHDIWRADAHLHSSATHEMATNTSKVITISLAISKLLCLVFSVRNMPIVLRKRHGSQCPP